MSQNFRVLITGSRTWDESDYIHDALTAVAKLAGKKPIILVSGACPTGADRWCEIVAEELGWGLELHPANWDKFGRKAGFVRNNEMVKMGADLCVGFIRDRSRGGSMTVRLAKNVGIPTQEHHWGSDDGAVPTCENVVVKSSQPDTGATHVDSVEPTLF